MKDAGLRIRVDRQLREAFVAACKEQDGPAAQVLRQFMREYVLKHERGKSPRSSKSQKIASEVPTNLGEIE
ncbi:MAG: plasmid-related protein [Sphingomonadaceae bacterium]